MAGGSSNEPFGNDDNAITTVSVDSIVPTDQSTFDVVVADDVMKHETNSDQIVTEVTEYVDLWGQCMPWEMVQKVFQLLVDSDGPLPVLCRYTHLIYSNQIYCNLIFCNLFQYNLL